MNHDFDIAASSYDQTFTNSNIGKAQRQQVYTYLNKLIDRSNPLDVLELNCGTGEDASYISQHGHKVIAIDISNEMIQVAKAKNKEFSASFYQQDITKITTETFDKKFDLIFSNFGGFNCLSKTELTAFLDLAPQLLSKKGKLVLVVMPKHTIWERIYFSLKGQIKKARRRISKTFVLANVDGIDVKTWYFNPSEIAKNALHFKLMNTRPIGLWIPPSYLEHSLLGKKSILNILKRLDMVFSWSFLSKYADHYYIELEKKSVDPQ